MNLRHSTLLTFPCTQAAVGRDSIVSITPPLGDGLRYPIDLLRGLLNLQTKPIRELVLERQLTFDEIERENVFLHNPTAYNGPKDQWELIVQDWLRFVASYREGDVVWQYRDIEAHLGFVAGDGGYMIRRGDSTIAKFVTYAVG